MGIGLVLLLWLIGECVGGLGYYMGIVCVYNENGGGGDGLE